MATISSALASQPVVDLENPLYCPAESVSKYLQLFTTDEGVRKLNRNEKPSKGRRKNGKKMTISSFSKMLAQVALAMRKDKKGRSVKEQSAFSLSRLSPDECHNYGTPARRRPIRKTRKDPAAQSFLDAKLFLTPSPQRGLSPALHSLSISLPKAPTDNLLSSTESPTSTISLSLTSDVSTETCITKSMSPRKPPGLGLLIEAEPSQRLNIKRNDLKPIHAQGITDQLALAMIKKRSLEEAFPELMKNTTVPSRSFSVEPKQEIDCSRHLSSRLVDLDQDDLRCIKRGRKLNYRVGNSPDGDCSKVEVDSKVQNVGSDSEQLKRRLQELEESVYGPRIGTETPNGYQVLVQKLDGMMPGIRLGTRLAQVGQIENERLYRHSCHAHGILHKSKDGPHQAAVDLLAAEGLLNERILNVFRTSEVTRLDLGPSLSEEGGLNLGGRAVWNVFTRPHSFLFLAELSFNNTPVLDIDLVKLVGLPRLTVLHLKNTGIGDEGVFHLVALKLTLTRLDLSQNPCVTDDAVPALNLCILSKVRFLGLVGTSIGMPGLRRMAKLIQREERIVDVEIPEACESYIDDIPNIYLLQPQPPLITSPALCSRLSAGALQRNLEAHAEVANKSHASIGAKGISVFTGGTKEEMCERLRDLLVKREVDLVVWGMIYGYGEVDETDWNGKDEKAKKYVAAQAAAREAHKRLR
ncbi:hypothetical protein FB446DRAFT_841389 [Lentinula raphanica]|nr:hypothetical protein FB446DRAFT_841389 [Lentinula raphanica]